MDVQKWTGVHAQLLCSRCRRYRRGNREVATATVDPNDRDARLLVVRIPPRHLTGKPRVVWPDEDSGLYRLKCFRCSWSVSVSRQALQNLLRQAIEQGLSALVVVVGDKGRFEIVDTFGKKFHRWTAEEFSAIRRRLKERPASRR